MSFSKCLSGVLVLSQLLVGLPLHAQEAPALARSLKYMVTENRQGTLTYKRCAWSGLPQDYPTDCQTVGFVKPDDLQQFNNHLTQTESATSSNAVCSMSDVAQALDQDMFKITLLGLSGGAVGAVLGSMLVSSEGVSASVSTFAGYITRLTVVIAGITIATTIVLDHVTGGLSPCAQLHSVVFAVLNRLYEDSLAKIPDGYMKIQLVPDGYWTFLGNAPLYHRP